MTSTYGPSYPGPVQPGPAHAGHRPPARPAPRTGTRAAFGLLALAGLPGAGGIGLMMGARSPGWRRRACTSASSPTSCRRSRSRCAARTSRPGSP